MCSRPRGAAPPEATSAAAASIAVSRAQPARDHQLRAREQGLVLPGQRPARRRHRQRIVRGRRRAAAAALLLLSRPARQDSRRRRGTGRAGDDGQRPRLPRRLAVDPGTHARTAGAVSGCAHRPSGSSTGACSGTSRARRPENVPGSGRRCASTAERSGQEPRPGSPRPPAQRRPCAASAAGRAGRCAPAGKRDDRVDRRTVRMCARKTRNPTIMVTMPFAHTASPPTIPHAHPIRSQGRSGL